MRAFFLMVLAVVIPGSSLVAQATIRGRIIHDSTKAPIAGAEVVFEKGPRAESDTAGKFELKDVPAGVGFAVIRKIGFRPVRLRSLVFGADTIEVLVRLQPSAVELAPIEVTASAVPPGMQAFAERRMSGFGTFIDSKVLRQSEARRLSDILRSSLGMSIIESRGRAIAASRRAGRACPMAVWLDGMRIYAPGTGMAAVDLESFPVSNLEAIEIYRGEAETPAELGGLGAGCGTIVLWTRRG